MTLTKIFFVVRVATLALLAITAAPAQEPHAPWFASASSVEAAAGRLPESIRIGLLSTPHAVVISCSGDYNYILLRGHHAKPVRVSKRAITTVKGTPHGMIIGRHTLGGSVLFSPMTPGSFMMVEGRSYRGALVVKPRGRGVVAVINHLDLEEYLYGVLPLEVGADWPAEALKAQAIVSRTFVAANLGKYEAHGYDLTGDVFSQAYGGQGGEKPAATRAVESTAGEILVDRQGAPIQAYFHSSCGGYTENPRYVWRSGGDPPDYLTSIRDDYCRDDPYHRWQMQITGDRLRRRLRKAGYATGEVRKIHVAAYAPSGRAWIIALDSTWGRIKIPANNFRIALGADDLRSVFITEIHHQGKLFVFDGRGWGHGVGFCQWGARGRALAGYSFEKILAAYYPHTKLVRWKYNE